MDKRYKKSQWGQRNGHINPSARFNSDKCVRYTAHFINVIIESISIEQVAIIIAILSTVNWLEFHVLSR